MKSSLTSRKHLAYLKKNHIATLSLLEFTNVCYAILAPLLIAANASLQLTPFRGQQNALSATWHCCQSHRALL